MNSLYYMAGIGIGLTVAAQSAINNQLKLALGGSTYWPLWCRLWSVVCACWACIGLLGQRLSQLLLLQNTPWWMLLRGALGAVFVFGSILNWCQNWDWL